MLKAYKSKRYNAGYMVPLSLKTRKGKQKDKEANGMEEVVPKNEDKIMVCTTNSDN